MRPSHWQGFELRSKVAWEWLAYMESEMDHDPSSDRGRVAGSVYSHLHTKPLINLSIFFSKYVRLLSSLALLLSGLTKTILAQRCYYTTRATQCKHKIQINLTTVCIVKCHGYAIYKLCIKCVQYVPCSPFSLNWFIQYEVEFLWFYTFVINKCCWEESFFWPILQYWAHYLIYLNWNNIDKNFCTIMEIPDKYAWSNAQDCAISVR